MANGDWDQVHREFDSLDAMAGDSWHYAYVAGALACAATLIAAAVLMGWP